MNQLINKLAVYSLSFVWISTAIISVFISPEIGFSVLEKANINGRFAEVFVYGGSLLDAILGIWIISKRSIKLCCWVQAITILIYTILLTIIDASFWMHPFGPLTKNIPILVLILVVYQQANTQRT